MYILSYLYFCYLFHYVALKLIQYKITYTISLQIHSYCNLEDNMSEEKTINTLNCLQKIASHNDKVNADCKIVNKPLVFLDLNLLKRLSSS